MQNSNTPSAISQLLSAKSRALGFDTFAITGPDLPESAAEGLQEYLANDHHGDMAWLESRSNFRASPRALWPEVQSILVVGHNYGPEMNPLEKLTQKSIGNISCYAQNEDYHDVMMKKLREFARFVAEEFSCEVKLFVDTAPVMEKPLAAAAGLGWQGKHTCLVSREFGSWLFLGCVFLSCDIREAYGHGISSESDPVQPLRVSQDSHCGTCTKCLDICPTKAFPAPYKLDARRCISYLTIEHKGQIPLEFRKAIGNRIYGCDDCLAVCPWNKFAKTSAEIAYHPRENLTSPLISELLQLDDLGFRALFRKSPVKRIGRARFVRNVLVAAGNSEDKNLIPLVEQLLRDPSPLVAEMAVWALGELSA